jgi:hypothetical protein
LSPPALGWPGRGESQSRNRAGPASGGRDALDGFSDSDAILTAPSFTIDAGPILAGVTGRLAELLMRQAGSSPTWLLVPLMAAAGPAAGTTAIVAMYLLPVLCISHRSARAPGSLMTSLSMTALCSGMTTLVAASPNPLVNGNLMRIPR